MIPLKTVEELINKHSVLESDLSSGKIDKKVDVVAYDDDQNGEWDRFEEVS